jgi:hypothetical protein
VATDTLNEFDISRLYFTYKDNLSENIGFRFTTDIRKVNNDVEKNYRGLYLKYAYIEFREVIPNSKIMVGLHYLPFLTYEETEMWPYRSVSKMMLDLEHKITSSDFGIGILGTIGATKYGLSLVNGEGYAGVETSNHKTFHGQLTQPIIDKSLMLSLFTTQQQHSADESTSIYSVLLNGRTEYFTYGIEYSTGEDAYKFTGKSVFVVVDPLPRVSLIGRVDKFDLHFREIFGIAFKVSDKVRIIVDQQMAQYSDADDVSNTYIHFHGDF